MTFELVDSICVYETAMRAISVEKRTGTTCCVGQAKSDYNPLMTCVMSGRGRIEYFYFETLFFYELHHNKMKINRNCFTFV